MSPDREEWGLKAAADEGADARNLVHVELSLEGEVT